MCTYPEAYLEPSQIVKRKLVKSNEVPSKHLPVQARQ